MRLSETPWFRWLLVALFLVTMFSLPWALGHPPQEQNYYQPRYRAENVVAAISPDERVADYTEALAWFTALLAIVSAAQGYFLWRADRAAKLAADRANQTTKDSMDLANKQFLMESFRADTAEKEHGLLRQQFIALNRPIIEIRSVGLRNSGLGAVLFPAGFPIKGSLAMRNAGGSEATILETEYRLYWSEFGLPMVPPLKGQPMAQTKPLLADVPHKMPAHGSCLVEFESHEAIGPDAMTINSQTRPRTVLWIMGAVLYADIAGNERWMGFCREYIPPKGGFGEGNFLPVQNPDYEYSD